MKVLSGKGFKHISCNLDSSKLIRIFHIVEVDNQNRFPL